jgi:hypothetical protein
MCEVDISNLGAYFSLQLGAILQDPGRQAPVLILFLARTIGEGHFTF